MQIVLGYEGRQQKIKNFFSFVIAMYSDLKVPLLAALTVEAICCKFYHGKGCFTLNAVVKFYWKFPPYIRVFSIDCWCSDCT